MIHTPNSSTPPTRHPNSERPLRVLQIMPQFPWPVSDGGKLSIATSTENFSSLGCEVHVLAFSKTPIPEQRLALATRAGAADVRVVCGDISNSPTNIAKALFHPLPLFVQKFQQRHFYTALNEVVRALQPDIIHADHSSMILHALHAARQCKAATGLRLHNVEWLIWHRASVRYPRWDPRRFFLASQAEKLRSFECKHYPLFNACFAISGDEAQRANDMAPEANVITAIGGVDTHKMQRDVSVERQAHKLVVATTFTWQPNIEALEWFIRQVMPLVHQKYPNAELTIIGKEPPQSLQNLSSEKITLTGYVESVIPYLSRASVYIAPLFVGGGIRLKILEALAMELPVIATAISAEGIMASAEQGLHRAETAAEFADIICSLIGQGPQYNTEGRRWTEANATWGNTAKIMLEEYKKYI